MLRVLEVLVDQEDEREKKREAQKQPMPAPVVHLERRPRHHHRHRGTDQDDRVDGAERHAQLAVRPFHRADAQQDVGGEQRAEQHHFGRQEQPDPELAVRQARVGPGFDCVRNVHVAEFHHGGTAFMLYARSGSNCGVKSFAEPGTLYS